MSEYGSAHSGGSGAHAKSAISVPWVVVASTLIGIGLFFVFYWIYNFDLWYTFGIALVVIGGLMLFSPRAGMDRA
jgi:hypothetical protein